MKVAKSIPRRTPPPSEELKLLIDKLVDRTTDQLKIDLNNIKSWNYGRGDLYNWVGVLDRFDEILENLIATYELERLQVGTFSQSDQELLVGVLRFSRLLVENCTNRNIYNSYERLNALLNCCDWDVLVETLKLSTRQAFRINAQKSYRHNFDISHQKILPLAETPVPLASNEFRFYRVTESPTVPSALTAEAKATKEEGWVTVKVDAQDLANLGLSGTFQKYTTVYEISETQKFRFYHFLRVKHLGEKEKAEEVRLYALAIAALMIPEANVNSRIFGAEPELINALVTQLKEGPEEIRIVACRTLEAISKIRNRTHEVLVAIGAAVPHGTLYTLLRQHTQGELREAELSFIGHLMQLHGNMLISAGIIPILLSYINEPQDGKNVAKAVGILDGACYAWHALPQVIDASGIALIVQRINVILLQLYPLMLTLRQSEAQKPPLDHERVAVLKAMLKFILHLIQQFGSIDGLRNLLDTQLPHTLSRVYEQPEAFGCSIVASCVNILAAIVHQEPTSLSILQELKLTDTFLAMATSQNVAAHAELLAALPNAFSACCLNASGLASFIEINPLKSYFRMFSSPEHRRVLLEGETAASIGSAIDELIRHQPELKKLIMTEVLQVLNEVCEPADQLLQTSQTSTVHERIEAVARFLEGIQNQAHSQDFLSCGGLDLMLRIFQLKGLPYDFASSSASGSLSNVARALCEVEAEQVYEGIINAIKKVLTSLSPYLELGFKDLKEGIGGLTALVLKDDGDLSLLQEIVALHGLVNLLVEVQSQNAFPPPLKKLCESPHVIHDLIKALQICCTESVIFRDRVPVELLDLVAGEEDPKKKKAVAVNFLLSELIYRFTAGLRGFAKMLQSKRVIEGARSFQILLVADALARLADVFPWMLSEDDLTSAKALEGFIDRLTTITTDDRNQMVHLAIVYGIHLSDKFKHIAAALKILSKMDDTSAASSLLGWLEFLSSTKAVIGTASTSVASRFKLLSELKINLSNLFTVVRVEVLEIVSELWLTPEVRKKLAKPLLRLLHLLITPEMEPPATTTTITPSLPLQPLRSALPPRLVADPDKVSQLTEMGFPLPAATTALIRCNNNITRATDYLLMHPELHVLPSFPSANNGDNNGETATEQPIATEVTAETPTDPAPSVPELETPEVASAIPATSATPATIDTNVISKSSVERAKKRLSELRTELRKTVLSLSLELVNDDLLAEVARVWIIFEKIDSIPVRLLNEKVRSGEEFSGTLRLIKMLLVEQTVQYRIAPYLDISLLEAALTNNTSIAALLSVFQELLTLDDEPAPADSAVKTKLISSTTRQHLLKRSLDILVNGENAIDLASAFGIIVRLTRYDCTDRLEILQAVCRKNSISPPVAVIVLRHLVESCGNILEQTMRRGIIASMAFPRTRWSDVSSFVRNTVQIVLREHSKFLDTVKHICTISDASSGKSPQLFLSPPSSNTEQLAVSEAEVAQVQELIKGIIVQILSLKVLEQVPLCCFLLNSLAELMASYCACQLGLLAMEKELREQFFEFLSQTLMTAEGKSTPLLSESVIAVLTAICAPCSDIEEQNHENELAEIRGFVLDQVYTAFKRILQEYEEFSLTQRYEKLTELGDLCSKLLVFRDPTYLRIEKLMLEKKFHNVLTEALMEIDLDHPLSTALTNNLLRPYEVLCRSASKMQPQSASPSSSSSSDDSSDQAEGDAERVASPPPPLPPPDLYQNSTLGILENAGEDEVPEEEYDYDDYDDDDDGEEDELQDIDESAASQVSEDQDSQNGPMDIPPGLQLPLNLPVRNGDDEGVGDRVLVEVEQNPGASGGAGWEDTDEEDEEEHNLRHHHHHHHHHHLHHHLHISHGSDDSSSHLDSEDNGEDDEDEDNHPEGHDDDRDQDNDDDDDEDDDDMDEEGGRHEDDLISFVATTAGGGGVGQTEDTRYLADPRVFQELRGGDNFLMVDFPANLAPPIIREISIDAGVGGGRRLGHRSGWRAIESLIGGVLGHLSTELLRHPPPADLFTSLSNAVSANGGNGIVGGVGEGDIPLASASQPLATSERWHQEARYLYGSTLQEKADRLIDPILATLTPPLPPPQPSPPPPPVATTPPPVATAPSVPEEPIASTTGEPPAPPEVSSVNTETATPAVAEEVGTFIWIDGHSVDISNTGIDPAFLEALPDDLRREVLNQHFSETRSSLPTQMVGTDDSPSHISHEFLQALPPDIREEILIEERLAAERERRLHQLTPPPPPPLPPSLLKPKIKALSEKVRLADRQSLAILIYHLCVSASVTKGRIQKVLQGLCATHRKVLTDVLYFVTTICLSHQDEKLFFSLLPPSVLNKKKRALMEISPVKQVQVVQRCLEFIQSVSDKDATIQYMLSLPTPPSPEMRGTPPPPPPPHILLQLLGLLKRPLYRNNVMLLELLTSLLATFTRVFSISAKSTKKTELPPISESTVQMVVDLLGGGECSSRAFQSTLAVVLNISHLSAVEKMVRKTMNACLVKLASRLFDLVRSLSDSIASEGGVKSELLQELASPASAQASFLRVLKAIDYIATSSSSSKSTASWLSPHSTLNELWELLFTTLTAIQEKDDASLASAILPLVESLMVVFKLETSNLLNSSLGSIVEFSEKNRKVLNIMVRGCPSLMSGSFSLLIQNPKVLDFDNKRNYFMQQLRKKSPDAHYSSIQLNVRRAYVFEDSFHQLQSRSGEEFKYAKLNIKFYDEEGVDAGGVTREWFQVLARQMFNPNYALFINSAVDKATYQPNRLSAVNQDHLMFFKFIGRIIGKAIYEHQYLDCHFTRSFYKHILGRQVDYRDVEAYSPEFYKSLCWILENDITGVLELTFSDEVDDFGTKKIIDLLPNGREITVDETNKADYVKLITESTLTLAIKPQIDAFLQGFNEVIPKNLVAIFNEQELELLISGLPEIDVDDWKNNTEYHGGYMAASPQIQWFWRAVRSFSQEERAKLLQFATGTSKVPLEGFSVLEGSSGVQKFQIHKDFSSPNRLPSAHTCFNQLDLPMYESYDQLRALLLKAIQECSTGFGFM